VSNVWNNASTERLTIACCVEYGPLEEGAVRLADSLRRFGGVHADARVVAVRPRFGSPLRASTKARFDELGVEYVHVMPRNPYAWMPYTNKYYALKQAEARAGGGPVAFFDSDMIVTGDLAGLTLADGVDIAACPRDKNIGTTGPDDENHAYWEKVCRDVGFDVDALPWVTTIVEDAKVRLYWNAGLFLYRPSSGFPDAWLQNIHKILRNTDASNYEMVFWVDQVAVGVTAAQMGLTYATLPGEYNYGIASHFKEHLTDDGLASARILHYHDSMTPELWPWFLEHLEHTLPDVHAWLAPLGPVERAKDPPRYQLSQGIRIARSVRRRAWSLTHNR
jgi:hypothetical protein